MAILKAFYDNPTNIKDVNTIKQYLLKSIKVYEESNTD